MSIQPDPNSNNSATLIPESNRLKFSLRFVALTTVGGALSLFPTILLKALLSANYPSNPVQPSLPAPIGLLDIVLDRINLSPNTDWMNWFGLLHGVAVQTVVGIVIGIFQWIVLRHYLTKGNWILATMLGYQIAALLSPEPISPAFFYASASRGIFQWLILKQVARDAWIWLLTDPLALLLSSSLRVLFINTFSGDIRLVYITFIGVLQAFVLCVLPRKTNHTPSV